MPRQPCPTTITFVQPWRQLRALDLQKFFVQLAIMITWPAGLLMLQLTVGCNKPLSATAEERRLDMACNFDTCWGFAALSKSNSKMISVANFWMDEFTCTDCGVKKREKRIAAAAPPRALLANLGSTLALVQW